MISVRIRVTHRLSDWNTIYRQEMKKALTRIAEELVRDSQELMSEDTGEQKRSLRSTVRVVTAETSAEVYSYKIQAFVDALGIAPRKIFPPWKTGSRLHRWASRKIAENPSIVASIRQQKNGPRKPRVRRRIKTLNPTAEPLANTRVRKVTRGDVNKFAFLVARKIHNKGIKGSAWNTKALDQNRAYIRQELLRGLQEMANRINNG